MFERLEKPFLTVETGEAYQPIRLTYELFEKDRLAALLNTLGCCVYHTHSKSWEWLWTAECHDLHFESLDTYQKNPEHPLRLATISIQNDKLHVALSSFKRACLAVPFFHKMIPASIAQIQHADFINKVFGLETRLPRGLTDLFKDEELDLLIKKRMNDYHKVQALCEQAAHADEALSIITQYADSESKKSLPYAERYSFEASEKQNPDPDALFLGFYIFLRSRELVAIRRWFGNASYTIADAAEESVGAVFGEMNIDIIE